MCLSVYLFSVYFCDFLLSYLISGSLVSSFCLMVKSFTIYLCSSLFKVARFFITPEVRFWPTRNCSLSRWQKLSAVVRVSEWNISYWSKPKMRIFSCTTDFKKPQLKFIFRQKKKEIPSIMYTQEKHLRTQGLRFTWSTRWLDHHVSFETKSFNKSDENHGVNLK